jgi:hypothetical protein
LFLTKVASTIGIPTRKSEMNKKKAENLSAILGWIVIITGVICYLAI